MEARNFRFGVSLGVHAAVLAAGLLWRGTPAASPTVRHRATVLITPPPVQHSQVSDRHRDLSVRPSRPVFRRPPVAARATPSDPLEFTPMELPQAEVRVTELQPAFAPSPGELPPPPIILGGLGAATVTAPLIVAGEIRSPGFGPALREDPQPVDRVGRGAAGFGDISASSAPAGEVRPLRRTAPVPTKAVEILSKPDPEYTPEARSRQVEGEVLLEVLFSASGDVRVLRIVRGLGYGLDEAAIRSAAKIRFRPAERNGAAVDQTAMIRIVFQLAY
jgi:protein TonB